MGTTPSDDGHILAMFGGRDFFGDREDAKFNLASGSGRQAGSAMKPIGLAAAVQGGIPVTSVWEAPSKIEIDNFPVCGEPWEVKGGARGASITLIEATRNSGQHGLRTTDRAHRSPESCADGRETGLRGRPDRTCVRRCARHGERQHGRAVHRVLHVQAFRDTGLPDHGHPHHQPRRDTAARSVPQPRTGLERVGRQSDLLGAYGNHRQRNRHPRATRRRPYRRRQDGHFAEQRRTPPSSATRRSAPPRCGSATPSGRCR